MEEEGLTVLAKTHMTLTGETIEARWELVKRRWIDRDREVLLYKDNHASLAIQFQMTAPETDPVPEGGTSSRSQVNTFKARDGRTVVATTIYASKAGLTGLKGLLNDLDIGAL